MADSRFVRQRWIQPGVLGIDGATLAAERTSNVIDLNGADRLTLYFDFTRAAYTAISISVDFSPFNSADYVQYKEQSVSVASGTGTLSDYSFAKTTSTSQKIKISLDKLDAKSAKVRVSATSGGASDLISVYACVSGGTA